MHSRVQQLNGISGCDHLALSYFQQFDDSAFHNLRLGFCGLSKIVHRSVQFRPAIWFHSRKIRSTSLTPGPDKEKCLPVNFKVIDPRKHVDITVPVPSGGSDVHRLQHSWSRGRWRAAGQCGDDGKNEQEKQQLGPGSAHSRLPAGIRNREIGLYLLSR
jgi:hypothetical protein